MTNVMVSVGPVLGDEDAARDRVVAVEAGTVVPVEGVCVLDVTVSGHSN